MTPGDSPRSETDWINGIKNAAAENDLQGFRNLLLSEEGARRGYNGLDPNNDEHVGMIMASVRKQIQEGENFRRSVASEGREPQTKIDKMAFVLGVAPETLISGSFVQGRGKEDKK